MFKYINTHISRSWAIRPVVAQTPIIVAHRGASKAAPENTLKAFHLAWEQGADAIEGDFHLTKDGKIVCIHDGNTKRYTNKNLTVSQSTLQELRTLDVGVRLGKKFKGTKIPTIGEVFATVPEGKKIYIEVKCGPEIIPTLLAEIKNSGLKNEQIIVISFKHQIIQILKSHTPQFKAYWLSHIKKDKAGKLIPSIATVLKTLKDINADGFSSSKNFVNESYIKSIMKNGYEYHVWTVDDAMTATRIAEWGAKSITTNVPGKMREELTRQAHTFTP